MRRLVAGAVVAALGLIALPAFVSRGSTVGAAVELEPLGLPAAAVVLTVLALRERGFTRPTGFVVRPAASSFVVPASRKFGFDALAQLIFLALTSSTAVRAWSQPDLVGLGARGATRFAVLGTACAVLLAVIAVPWIVMVLRGRPVLELTPDGLLVRQPLGVRMFPWDAMRPGSPVRGFDTVTLVLDRPELVRRSGWMWRSRRIPMGNALVHSWFFADAVRLYVLHPGRRAAIGTPEEFTRLLVDLGVLVPAT